MPIQIGHQGDHGFEQPLGLLSDCHRRIERFLNAMLVVSREQKGRLLGAEERSALKRATVYFQTAAPLHTADEEQGLFPLLRSHAGDQEPELVGKLDALESEHHSNEAVHAKVDTFVGRWLEHGALPERDALELIELLESLEQVYTDHVRIEDEQIFPAAARLLSAHVLEDLGRQMAERRELPFRGPIARFLCEDHEQLGALLTMSTMGEEGVRMAPFDQFRAGILRHISMEEKLLIPAVTAANGGERPAIADMLRVDQSRTTPVRG